GYVSRDCDSVALSGRRRAQVAAIGQAPQRRPRIFRSARSWFESPLTRLPIEQVGMDVAIRPRQLSVGPLFFLQVSRLLWRDAKYRIAGSARETGGQEGNRTPTAERRPIYR